MLPSSLSPAPGPAVPIVPSPCCPTSPTGPAVFMVPSPWSHHLYGSRPRCPCRPGPPLKAGIPPAHCGVQPWLPQSCPSAACLPASLLTAGPFLSQPCKRQPGARAVPGLTSQLFTPRAGSLPAAGKPWRLQPHQEAVGLAPEAALGSWGPGIGRCRLETSSRPPWQDLCLELPTPATSLGPA